jgi:hypothetical protein
MDSSHKAQTLMRYSLTHKAWVVFILLTLFLPRGRTESYTESFAAT